jgi:hypothetical protein
MIGFTLLQLYPKTPPVLTGYDWWGAELVWTL